MAKWAFDDNVSRVRPKLRLGKGPEEGENPTEPPPARPADGQAPDAESAAAPAPAEQPEPRRRSMVRDLIAASEEITHDAKVEAARPPEPVSEPKAAAPAPEPVVEAQPVEPQPQPIVEAALPEASLEAAPVDPAPIEPAVASADVEPEPLVVAPAPPAPPRAPARPSRAPEPPISASTPASPAVSVDYTPDRLQRAEDVAAAIASETESANRRASLKRRAAGLGALPEPTVSAPPLSSFDELDALESAAELATELERALGEAAEANELLRRDLGTALDDLARSTADNRRLQEKIERLDGDGRDRGRVVQDLVRELELLEGERDGALAQASEGSLEIESLGERALLTERRVHELERALSDAQARTRRFEEASQAQAAQRAALRAELEGVRRERDTLLGKTAELEREREDLTRSRRALDEVHRALSDARQRAQRIRPR